uniref:Ribonuclease H-like domain-containing protein n=1 Tax=Tanacetum cinerariifolium TaxID=118510 RepID=A0A6L2MVJ2_TANCI|nr:ribonuclease H-like domain-containing protein [Tanacetum cinerariifolium]
MEREIKRLKRSRIPLVKVRWNSRRGPEFTWERDDSFKKKYPHLFTNRTSSSITRVLVNKSYNKTPYELFNGRTPAIGFLKPFGCHVMILNTLDHLEKFEAKWDEGYFIGYSMSSKAFRVFNKRTKRVEENLHVDFLENKTIEKGAGPNWLFDIDSLTKSMNYVLVVVAGTNSTNLSGTKDAASQEVNKDVSSLRYITLPNWVCDALLESSSSKPQDDCSTDVPKSSGNLNPTATSTNPPTDQIETLTVETPIPTVSSPVPTACFTDSQEPSIDSDGVKADVSNMETTIIASPTPTLRIHKDHPKSQIIGPVDTLIQTMHKSKEVGEQSFIAIIHQKTDPTLLQFCLFSCFLSQVEPKKISDSLQDPSWVEAMQEDLLQFKIQNMDVKSAFLYGTIDEEVYVMHPLGFQDSEFSARVYKVEKAMYGLHQAPRAWYGTLSKYLLINGFQRGTIDQTLFIKRQRGDFILVQVYVDDIIFGSSNPQLCREFKALMHEKFQKSAMGELHFFLGLQVLQKEDDIFLSQDNKSIFRYLKGHPRLGLWYPKESPFDLVAYSDSDYGGATQDRKSTTGGCQFLGRRLISWQCKKQTIMATSTTEVEYVAAASGCGQVLWIQNQLLDYGDTSRIEGIHRIRMISLRLIPLFWSTARIETTEEGTKILATVDGNLRTVSESSIRRNLKLNDEAGISRIVPLFDSMLVPQGEGSGIPTEHHYTPSLEAQQTSPTTHSSPPLPPVTTVTIPPVIPTLPLPTVIPTDTPQLRHYTRRARIAQSSALPHVADEPASPIGDVSQGKACPTVTGLVAGHDRANITKSSTLPHESTSRVTSLAADEGNDAPINGRRLDEGEEVAERVSDDTEEMATVLTSMDAASILTSGGVQVVPTVAAEVATANVSIPTGSGVVSTASPTIPTGAPIFTTATESTPYTRRKGKEKMVESDTPKKKKLQEQIDVHTQQKKPLTRKQQREFYTLVLKNQAGWKARHFKGMTLEEIKEKFDLVWKQIQDFIPIGSKEESERLKRKGIRFDQDSAKKQKTSEEVPEEKLKEMMELIPVEEVLGGSSASYQFFVDLLKHFDREDLNQRWALVNESLSNRSATSDKEKELWVELKRLIELDVEDYLWTHTQNLMHAQVEWKLYDTCGVHHVSTKDQDIFMLIEKDYPLRKGLAIVMISYKLLVENYSQMASDLILKIHKIANRPRQEDD